MLGPLIDERILGGLSLSKDTCLLLEGIVLVLVDEATLSRVSHAVVNEVRNELVHLPGVEVIWKWEEGVSNTDVVLDGSVLPWCGEEVDKDWSKGFAVFAEEIPVDFKLDA